MKARIYDATGRQVDVLYPEDPERCCWGAKHGGGLCGGCDHCLMRQAIHANNALGAGLDIEWVPDDAPDYKPRRGKWWRLTAVFAFWVILTILGVLGLISYWDLVVDKHWACQLSFCVTAVLYVAYSFASIEAVVEILCEDSL